MRNDTRSTGARHPILAIAPGFLLVGCGETSGLPARPNILLFVLDAARVDHFGAYVYPRDTTPHIDAFADGSTRFTQAIADGSFTFASVSALFSGLPPDRTGLLKARRLGDELTLLPEVARRSGYRTCGYSENPYVTPTFGFDRGFDVFDAALAYRDFKRDVRGFEHVDSSPGIDAILSFMSDASERPFFAYVHLLRPHNPYAPPDGFAGRFGSHDSRADGSTRRLLAVDKRKGNVSPERLDNIRALCDESLAAGDTSFGRLVDGMKARGLLDDAVVVLLSDHGEAFLEHGRLLHGTTTFDEMIRIPLLIRIPGYRGGAVDQPLQLARLGELLEEVVSGSRSALDLVRARAGEESETISWAMQHEHRACVRTKDRKLIVNTETLEALAYYDLETDPGERLPMPLDSEGERLLTEIESRILNGHASLAHPPASAIDPELLERIRALGYAEE